jgi:hypothetical protein
MNQAVFWLFLFCVDSCFPTPKHPEARMRMEMAQDWMTQDNANGANNLKTWEEENKKTRCEMARTDLFDKAAHANRGAWGRCAEQPASGHFNYLQE